MKRKTLLGLDATVNFVLGLLLLVFPRGIMEFLGAPVPESTFYSSILGAVLIGIGFALLLERFQRTGRMPGLGLGGAITINTCGAGALMVWLIFGDLKLPLRGVLLLWFITIVVLGIGFVEIMVYFKESKSVKLRSQPGN